MSNECMSLPLPKPCPFCGGKDKEMHKRIIEIECNCCGECPYYNWKKHKCRLGAVEGEQRDPFYSDCPLNWRNADEQ